MKSRELTLLPGIRPLAILVGDSLDVTLSGSPALVPAVNWSHIPEVVLREGARYYYSVDLNVINSSLANFTLQVRTTVGAQHLDGDLVESYRPGRAGEPYTLATLPRWVFSPHPATIPAGLATFNIGVFSPSNVRLMAPPGRPATVTLWEAPLGEYDVA